MLGVCFVLCCLGFDVSLFCCVILLTYLVLYCLSYLCFSFNHRRFLCMRFDVSSVLATQIFPKNVMFVWRSSYCIMIYFDVVICIYILLNHCVHYFSVHKSATFFKSFNIKWLHFLLVSFPF